MADEALARAGLHFDELNKIRVLEPDVAQQTVELKEECKEFVDSKYMHYIEFHHYCFIQYEFLTLNNYTHDCFSVSFFIYTCIYIFLIHYFFLQKLEIFRR